MGLIASLGLQPPKDFASAKQPAPDAGAEEAALVKRMNELFNAAKTAAAAPGTPEQKALAEAGQKQMVEVMKSAQKARLDARSMGDANDRKKTLKEARKAMRLQAAVRALASSFSISAATNAGCS